MAARSGIQDCLTRDILRELGPFVVVQGVIASASKLTILFFKLTNWASKLFATMANKKSKHLKGRSGLPVCL